MLGRKLTALLYGVRCRQYSSEQFEKALDGPEWWSGLGSPVPTRRPSGQRGQGNGPEELRVSAELPGLEEKELELPLSDDVLTIRGEKRSEFDKERQFSEPFYGRFGRRIPLGSEIEEDQLAASFRTAF